MGYPPSSMIIRVYKQCFRFNVLTISYWGHLICSFGNLRLENKFYIFSSAKILLDRIWKEETSRLLFFEEKSLATYFSTINFFFFLKRNKSFSFPKQWYKIFSKTKPLKGRAGKSRKPKEKSNLNIVFYLRSKGAILHWLALGLTASQIL